ncbi:MAG TPA: tryptophan synthase subunit alpha [Actinomycetota bacterium]|jgi:tryptophan synthase alpha chain
MKTLAIYLMAGAETPALAAAAIAGGADVIEIGFPFSDPIADGPVIRQAAERALAGGMRTRACLDCLAETRSVVEGPVIPMCYAATVEAYGYGRFADDAAAAGATSLIVPDLPIEERPELRRVHLVAPTTPSGRIRLALERTDGWLYLVSLLGTTGNPAGPSAHLPELVERVRAISSIPLLVGFGISTPDQAAAAAAIADGVVVGSGAVRVAEESGPSGLRDYVSSLRHALDRVVVRSPA